MNYFLNASDFLVQTLLGIILFVALLRFWMQWVRADFRNEIGQFVITVTNPVIIPLRKIIPSIGSIDSATVVTCYLLALIKGFVFLAMRGIQADPLAIAVLALGELIEAAIYLLLIAVIVKIIASWISPRSYHPVVSLAHSISEPIMAPARRLLPPIAGIDFSPILVILFLQFSLRLFVAPLLSYPF